MNLAPTNPPLVITATGVAVGAAACVVTLIGQPVLGVFFLAWAVLLVVIAER